METFKKAATPLKAAAVLLFCIWGGIKGHSLWYFVIALLEGGIFFALTDVIGSRFPRAGRVFNDITIVLLLLQICFLSLGGDFVSMQMLTNTDSISSLGGKTIRYALFVILAIIAGLLPVHYLEEYEFPFAIPDSGKYLAPFLAAELVLSLILGNVYSPVFTLGKTAFEGVRYAGKSSSAGADASKFYLATTDQSFPKPENLPEKPNVVLILTEGLSERIILDDREITPNLASFRDGAICFSDYYNHTFATYRGIIGQLYSGYQGKNTDPNGFVSLQKLFSDEGYHTTFINTEPNNATFTGYLESMGFDEVVDATGKDAENEVRTDKEAYEILYDVCEKNRETGTPFFTCIYTYGTHVSFDSPDEKYGDGKDAFLNKFYNMDAQFGAFWDKVAGGDLAEDTVIIFTADHATYADEDFTKVYGAGSRADTEIDSVPFYIWYQGITPGVISADGRNSLDLAPTICDFLDIEGKNAFLGGTLFRNAGDVGNNFDTVFFDGFYYKTTQNGAVKDLDGKRAEIVTEEIAAYMGAAVTG